MKLSEVVKKVMKLATTIRQYWKTELPKHHRDYPFVRPGEKEVPPPPEEQELERFFASLPEDMVYQIGLIMYLGRQYFDVDGMAEYSKTLKEDFPNSTELASMMTCLSTLTDDLQEGLAELKKHKMDVNKLSLKPVKARK